MQSIVGFGLGLRPNHYSDWKNADDGLWVEVMSDNYIHQAGGRGVFHLGQAVKGRHVVMHGVGLNIAGVEKLNSHYLDGLTALAEKVQPEVLSDHLCFTRTSDRSTYDLLPFPYTRENLNWVARRVNDVQRILKRRLSLENLSRYVSFKDDEMSEFEFISRLCHLTGCGILLDVNNVIVSATNLRRNAAQDLQAIEAWMVTQYHVAGHTKHEGWLHDTHDQPVNSECWELLSSCRERFGHQPVILENDEPSTSFSALLEEVDSGLRLSPPENSTVWDAPNHLREFQNHFVNVVYTPPWDEIRSRSESVENVRVNSDCIDQLDVYRHCFFSRITNTLSETVLLPLTQEYGSERVQAWLANYAIEAGFNATLLQDTLSGFINYLEQKRVSEQYPQIFEVLSLCVARWSALTGADEALKLVDAETPLDAIFLNPTSQFSFLNASKVAINGSAPVSEFSGRVSQIVFRTSPVELHTLKIPAECADIAESLKNGLALSSALETEGLHHNETSAPVVQQWLASMFKMGGLTARTLSVILAFFAIFSLEQTASAEVWKLQTERLIQVSGSLLDDIPSGVTNNSSLLGIDVGGTATLLPRVNPKVGSKQEGVPSAPAHFVPTFALSASSDSLFASKYSFALRGWYGLLPATVSRLVVGRNTQFDQMKIGLELSVLEKRQQFFTGISLAGKAFYQTGDAQLKGYFSTQDQVRAKDSFEVTTSVGGISLIALHDSSGAFFETLGLIRTSKTEFYISEDDNLIVVGDGLNRNSLELGSGTLGGQISLGWNANTYFQIGVSQLILPERFSALRAFLRLQHSLISEL
ncbi:MAG: hypothetical protein RL189_1427 [Pseudomonadota bacterium]|jgi:uncharacterized protein (UPF0276 family)